MFSDGLIAFRGGRGSFPDMILRTNKNHPMFSGGEFVEVKDTMSYSIASFNSTMPGAHKRASECIARGGKMHTEMQKNGEEDPYLLETREVYYLIRGRNGAQCKVCLVCGGFFETISVTENIRSALQDVLHEALQDSKITDRPAAADAVGRVLKFDWKREHLAKVRKAENASVSIRMRVMAEVINDANILNSGRYPAVKDDTLNMIVRAGGSQDDATRKMEAAFNRAQGGLPGELTVSGLKHLRNGEFVLFQAGI